MSYLHKKIKEGSFPEHFAQKVFQLEQGENRFEEGIDELLKLLSKDHLHILLEYILEDENFSREQRITILKKLLANEEATLREKAVFYLESFLHEKLVPLIEPLLTDDSHQVRVRVYWVLAKYSSHPDLLELILLDFKLATEDNELILLAAALYLLNNDPTSYEMRFLREYYLEHYFDLEKNELKVSLTGVHGYPAQIIGLILWEAGIKLYKRGSFEKYNLRWLISKD